LRPALLSSDLFLLFLMSRSSLRQQQRVRLRSTTCQRRRSLQPSLELCAVSSVAVFVQAATGRVPLVSYLNAVLISPRRSVVLDRWLLLGRFRELLPDEACVWWSCGSVVYSVLQCCGCRRASLFFGVLWCIH